jgi:hypothetical protein
MKSKIIIKKFILFSIIIFISQCKFNSKNNNLKAVAGLAAGQYMEVKGAPVFKAASDWFMRYELNTENILSKDDFKVTLGDIKNMNNDLFKENIKRFCQFELDHLNELEKAYEANDLEKIEEIFLKEVNEKEEIITVMLFPNHTMRAISPLGSIIKMGGNLIKDFARDFYKEIFNRSIYQIMFNLSEEKFNYFQSIKKELIDDPRSRKIFKEKIPDLKKPIESLLAVIENSGKNSSDYVNSEITGVVAVIAALGKRIQRAIDNNEEIFTNHNEITHYCDYLYDGNCFEDNIDLKQDLCIGKSGDELINCRFKEINSIKKPKKINFEKEDNLQLSDTSYINKLLEYILKLFVREAAAEEQKSESSYPNPTVGKENYDKNLSFYIKYGDGYSKNRYIRKNEVKNFQRISSKLGYRLKADGVYGDNTAEAVQNLQTKYDFPVNKNIVTKNFYNHIKSKFAKIQETIEKRSNSSEATYLLLTDTGVNFGNDYESRFSRHRKLRLELRTIKGNKVISKIYVLSGSGRKQSKKYFTTAAKSVSGDYWPLPESVWDIAQHFRKVKDPKSRFSWAKAVDLYEGYWKGKGKKGLGSVIIALKSRKPTKRRAILIHEDAGPTGTAGCLGIPSKRDLKRFVSEWMKGRAKYLRPNILVVNWGHGTVSSKSRLSLEGSSNLYDIDPTIFSKAPNSENVFVNLGQLIDYYSDESDLY